MTKIHTALSVLAACAIATNAMAAWKKGDCKSHTYPPGTTVMGCGKFTGDPDTSCGGNCGYTRENLTYSSCDKGDNLCSTDSPIIIRRTLTQGGCFSKGAVSPHSCACLDPSPGQTFTGGVALPQCHNAA